jgi:MoaA/NifB/PqqE/SkfB family radical SAM enzyme
MTDSIEEALLKTPRTRSLLVEFTTRFNLRCAYCAVSQPSYVGARLPLEHFDALTTLIVERRPEIVMVNGHGETTTVKDWDRYCRRWIDLGLDLKIITNLAKELSHSEVETLARFRKLVFSIDTADPTLFEQLRRGARFEVFSRNVRRIANAAAHQSRRHGRRARQEPWSQPSSHDVMPPTLLHRRLLPAVG